MASDPVRTNNIAPHPTLSVTDGGPGAAVLQRLRFGPWDFGARAPRVALLLAVLTWPPLFVLSLIHGVAFGGVQIPFIYDLSAHVRFLFAVPALVLADLAVGTRLRRTASHFVAAGLVSPSQEGRFAEIIVDTIRFRDSRIAELIVLGAAYLGTFAALRSGPAHGLTSWFQMHADGSLAGVNYWYAFVALPVFQFLVFRWVYRMVVWARFLWQVARLDLQVTPTHPDGAGGLGFLGKSAVAYGPVLFALSAVTASGIATSILFGGGKLQTFQSSYIALTVIALVVFAGPLLVFAPTLMTLKQQGLVQYGTLASRYTQLFHRKWVVDGGQTDESILGSADIQSLADLGTTFEMVRKIRIVPIELADFIAIAIPGVVPAIPLLATVMPVGDIFKGLLRLLG